MLLISVDGLRPDALLQAETPQLDRLWRNGVHSWSAQTVLPSSTLPAHASMLSGQPPDIHQIVWNDWQPQRGFIRVPTILSVANGAGLEVGFIVGKRKLEQLAPPGCVDHFDFPGSDADTVAQAAMSYLVEARPNLLILHFADVDEAGHRSGWMSTAQLEAVARVDAAIGRLLEALAQSDLLDDTLIIVSADHGGHFFSHGSDSPEEITIPWIAHGPGVREGYQIEVSLSIMDTAATVLYALGLPIPEAWAGRPLVEIFAAVESGSYLATPLPIETM
ncbi:MAG: alkaline phosphatase family protein [Chloroflexi bacterium]|nr:alkaline phosphatase family protein [Chloroflexota bacterium]